MGGGTYTNLANGSDITGATSNVLTILNSTNIWALGYEAVSYTHLDVYKRQAPIGASVYNTYASSSYVTGAGNSVGSIANGIVATKSTNNTIEYIHVLNPPSGKSLSLPVPSDGKTFTSAQLLANGQPVTLIQNGSGVSLKMCIRDRS